MFEVKRKSVMKQNKRCKVVSTKYLSPDSRPKESEMQYNLLRGTNSNTLEHLQYQEVVDRYDRVIADWQNQWETVQERVMQIEGDLAQRDQQLTEKDLMITEQKQLLVNLQVKRKKYAQRILHLKKTLPEITQKTAEGQRKVAEEDKIIEELKIKLAREEESLVKKSTEIARRNRSIRTYHDELFSVYMSRSWRYTSPMRKVGTMIRHILAIPHKPQPRAMIKKAYFCLPLPLRNSHPLQYLKEFFKDRENRI